MGSTFLATRFDALVLAQNTAPQPTQPVPEPKSYVMESLLVILLVIVAVGGVCFTTRRR